jgi:hypothetical protein
MYHLKKNREIAQIICKKNSIQFNDIQFTLSKKVPSYY